MAKVAYCEPCKEAKRLYNRRHPERPIPNSGGVLRWVGDVAA